MKTAFIILAAMPLLFVPCRLSGADNPVGVAATFAANKFYRTCLKLEPRGLPTSDQMERFAPLFTNNLVGMIEDAGRHRTQLIRENPASRQPWRQGHLFVSLHQGFSFYAIGMPVMQDDNIATVPIHLEYHYRGDIARWLDVIVLVRSGRHWLVD